jgi:hypothetical protein
MNMNVMEGGVVYIHHHQRFTINDMEANAVQNGVTRFLGPQLPASKMMPDQLLVLEQVKNDATSKTGDRGIIDDIQQACKASVLQRASEARDPKRTSQSVRVHIPGQRCSSFDGRPARDLSHP